MNLLYFLSVEGGGWNGKRRVNAIWESSGGQDHRQVFGTDVSAPLNQASRIISVEHIAAAHNMIDAIMGSGVHTIQEVRTILMEGRR